MVPHGEPGPEAAAVVGGAGADGGDSGAEVGDGSDDDGEVDGVGRWRIVGEDRTLLGVSVVPQPASRVPTATKTTNGRARGILVFKGFRIGSLVLSDHHGQQFVDLVFFILPSGLALRIGQGVRGSSVPIR